MFTSPYNVHCIISFPENNTHPKNYFSCIIRTLEFISPVNNVYNAHSNVYFSTFVRKSGMI